MHLAREANAIGFVVTTEIHIPAMTIDLSNGYLAVTAPMKIIGAGFASTVVEQGSGALPGYFISHWTDSGALTVQGLTIRGFTGKENGAVTSATTLAIVGCDFEANSTTWYGKGAVGGAIYMTNGGQLTVQGSVFSDNHADSGGGAIATSGPTTIDGSIFEGNTAGWASEQGIGGAVYQPGDIVTISRSLFAGNAAGQGGAIYQSTGTLRINNSTISGNQALTFGGGIYSTQNVLTTRFFNSTIASNDADSDSSGDGAGGGLYVESGGIPGAVRVANSILAGNTDTVTIQPGGNVVRVPRECRGNVQSNGYNIFQNDDSSCTISGSILATDPQLQPLSYNGGFSATRAIGPGSPAVDAGNPSGCLDDFAVPISDDQRGTLRPSGADCDLGAFEYGPLIFSDDFELGVTGRWTAHAP